ncbi:two component transcriptional regulator, LuxR family [Halpernia humi]|uniref:Two component transcriptional regulator, LuxR family n=1 Tax=Halpernia humi TaxID=493375 RepID=A0A1H6BKC1_9FLAO|nr:response regulator transcription factor [Halpernia humi]SEG60656.1 two component transcriptional regulator, LuxR family [Halpernia humi]
MNPIINIAVVDDNHFLIKAVEEKLSFFDDIKIKFTAYNGAEIIEKLQTSVPHLILMDIEMPVKNGIEATVEIKNKWPQIKIIMLTVFDNDENIYKAIKGGADGYLLKDIEAPKLYEAILETLNGGAAMTPSVAMKTLKLLKNPVEFSDISEIENIKLGKREIEVLEQLSSGLQYVAIAENLFISPATVRKHIENIYAKLEVHSKLEAVQKARKNNLI